MSNYNANNTAYWIVVDAVEWAVYRAVDGDVYAAVAKAVAEGEDNENALYEAIATYRAVDRTVRVERSHPALQDFLREACARGEA